MSAKSSGKSRDRILLVDGSGFIFRAYHALPPLTRKDGTPVGAVLGFCNMLWKLIEDAQADGSSTHLAVIFDAGRHTFRNKIYPEYKAHRPEAPEDLVPQFALVRDATRAFGVPAIEADGFEADDVIATYASQGRKSGHEVVIVSSDKDLMQLVGGGVGMLDPIKLRTIGPAEVMEKFGVGPEKVVDVQSLAGDSTDNVPGVPGIGVKTAAQLINEYGDLDTLLKRAGEIKQPKRREALLENADKARISRELVRLRHDVPLKEKLDDFTLQLPDPAQIDAFLAEMQFERLRARVGEKLARTAPKSTAGKSADAAKPPSAKSGDAAAGAKPQAGTPGYSLIQDMAALKNWIERAFSAGEVTVDTETTSLRTMRAELVGISLAILPGEACYIPLGHSAPAPQGTLDLGGPAAAERPKQIPLQDALAALKPLLEDLGVLKVGQNIKYDMEIFAKYGIRVGPVDDTMLMSFVLDAGLHGHGMDELSELHLNHKTISFSEVAGSGKTQVTFDKVPLADALNYAAEDADVTLKLHRVLKPRLLDERMMTVYETIERPLIPVLVDMETAGIMVDRKQLAALSQEFAARMVQLEKQIHKLAGEEFNIGSPKQLGEILFDKMSLGGGKKGKTGAYGTGADVLEALAAQGHDLPARVLDWRQVQKLKSTYTDALQEEIDAKTGRVHTSYAMAGASTGRLASTEPNLQNIPIRTEDGRKIRHAFVAPKGAKLLSADYSQIELRLLAHIAGIDALKKAFKQGADIHALTASQVFNVPLENMDPNVRRSAKTINFGIIYGMSAFGLAAQLGIPQKDAQAYIDAYFKRYPGIRDYMERTKVSCREKGYVTTMFGRRVHLPGINDKNPARRNFMERAAINAPLQGSAADIIKRAMIRVPPALKKAGLRARMLLQVHDELVFEVPDAEVDKTAKVVKQVMEGAAALSVPLTVDTGSAQSWAEAH
ncbi:MAG TPA: DNA polymerase I [Candidatus Cybelea sp.]|nr:DNA polymerase I [Candidatus Cybelea sp.]